MSTTSAEILIELDRTRPRGLRAQVEDELRDAIRSGRLAPGTSLPSSRALATDLGVTRGVVVAAYDQLIAEGYLTSHHGSGTIVTATAHGAPARRTSSTPAPSVLVDFRPGLPDLDLFPRAAWQRASRAALQTLPRDDLGYIDSRGLERARQAIADYLARVRGVCAHADQVIICNGFGHGFTIVAGVLRHHGHKVIAVEDPGYEGAVEVLAELGMRSKPVAVDDDGIDVAELRRSRVRAVVVTPAHQNPTGAVLSAARRTALVEWARAVDGYVIEDDYDAEYRYDRHPAGAVQGLDPDRVIYCGTTSKSLAPGLRLGWIVVPDALVEPVVRARRPIDSATSSFTQATYAEFLVNGDLDRHLRRTRRVYRQRRDALIAALGRWFPDAVPCGASAGLHVLVTLPRDLDERGLARRALEEGVRVYPLGPYRSRPRPDDRGGFVLGYGSLSLDAANRGAHILGAAAAASRQEARRSVRVPRSPKS
jgi:GntR family transcriptional regulator/MocR family aminotransferase